MAEIIPETRRSPSETLMGALEDIDNCQELLIIKVNAEGSIEWHSTTNTIHKKLGMIDYVHACILDSAFERRA